MFIKKVTVSASDVRRESVRTACPRLVLSSARIEMLNLSIVRRHLNIRGKMSKLLGGGQNREPVRRELTFQFTVAELTKSFVENTPAGHRCSPSACALTKFLSRRKTFLASKLQVTKGKTDANSMGNVSSLTV